MPVRPELIDAVIQQESGGRANPPDAGAGAVGLMQIEPETAKAYGFDPAKLRDPAYNRKAGTSILNALLEKHKGDEREALKSYYGRGKPKSGFPTSDEYANRVLAMAGPDDPLSAALAGGTGSTAEDDPLSAALAQEAPAQKPKRYARPLSIGDQQKQQIEARIASNATGGPVGEALGKVLPSQGTALATIAGGPAAEAGEAVLGSKLGGMISRAVGLGALGAGQSLLEHPTDFTQAGISAGWNFGFGLAGEMATNAITKGVAEVGPYAKKIAGQIGDLAPNKVKALFHIKQFLKAAGRTPEEMEGFTRGLEAQQTFADAHQNILNETHKVFSQDYDEVLAKPEVKAATVDTAPVRDKLNDTMAALEKDNRLGQLSPGVKRFIDQTKENLNPDPLKGLIPPEELASMSSAQRASYIKALPAKGAQPVTPLAAGEKVSRFGLYGAAASGDRFHGTSTPIDRLQTDTYSTQNTYGQGFYTTDNPSVAAGYAKKGGGGEPTIYNVTEKPGQRLVDLDKKPAPAIQRAVNALSESRGPAGELGEFFKDNPDATLRQWYDEMRGLSGRDTGFTADDIQEEFTGLQNQLEAMGYNGLTHIGGRNTGTPPHKVNIYFNPKKSVDIAKSAVSPGAPATAQAAAAAAVPGKSVDEMRSDLSQIRKMSRGRTTATDRAVLNDLHNSVVDQIDKTLTTAGSPPEDLTKLRAVDQRYRQFQQTMNRLGDPRQALTGAEAAKEIFDAAENQNYGAVEEYVKLAKAAATVHPEVLTDLKDAVLTKVIADARETAAKAQTSVFGQVGEIRKLQSTFASQVPEAMETLFGKGSPMVDVRKTNAIFGRIASPEAKQEAITGASKTGIAQMLSPRYLARFMLLYSTFAALSGSATSPWTFPRQNPAAGIAIGLGMLWGPQAAKFIFSHTGLPAQQAYTNWIMEPDNPAKLRRMVDTVAAGIGHATAQPAEEQPAEAAQ